MFILRTGGALFLGVILQAICRKKLLHAVIY